MADAVGNIHVALYVDTGQTRRFSAAANIIDRDSQRMRTALGSTSRSVTHLRTQMSMNMRGRMFNDMIRQSALANNELAKLRAAMLGLAALTGTSLTGAFTATWLLHTADRARLLSNQLRTVTDSSEELLAVQQRLFDLSQESRSSLDATARMYARLSRAVEFFGMKQEDVVRVTETIQKAFAIGGATQAEAFGAAIQLSQGIASDRFSGEEFRSVAENAPVLLGEMARSLGVNIGKLREMAHAGELTGEVVTNAILRSSAAIDESFAKTEVTVGQAITKLSNAFLMYIGNTDQSVGVTRRLNEALGNLSEHFDEIANLAAVIAGAGIAVFGGRTLGRAVAGGTASLFSQIIPSKAELSEAKKRIAELAQQRLVIRNEMEQLRKALATGPGGHDAFAQQQIDRQQPAVERALVQQARLQGKINDLEISRLIAADKLAAMQQAGVGRLQKEVTAARARNAVDAKHLGDTQKVVAAEQTRLRALREWRLQFVATAEDIRKVRAETASSPMLVKALAAEQKALGAFDKSLGTLQGRLRDLQTAMATGFQNAGTRRMVVQIADLNDKIKAAQKQLIASNAAVAKAGTLDEKALAAAQTERAAALARINVLQDHANKLTAQGTMLVKAMTVQTRALTALRNAGASILGFLGGWTGVAFIAAIAGITTYYSEVAKAEERTNRWKKELHDLGMISDDVAGHVDEMTKSIEEMAADELRNKLRDLMDEIGRLRGEQNILQKVLSYDQAALGNLLAQLRAIRDLDRQEGGAYLNDDSEAVAAELEKLVQTAIKGDMSAADLLLRLDELAAKYPNVSAELDKITTTLRTSVPLLEAMVARAEQLAEAAEQTATATDNWLTGHAQEMAAQDAANATVREWLQNLEDVTAEMEKIAGFSPEESELNEETERVLKAWEEINEEKGLSTVLSRELAEEAARGIIAQRKAAEAAKEQVEAIERSKEAMAEYRADMRALNAELQAAGRNVADREAAEQIREMVDNFIRGRLPAEELQSRLNGIASTNVSSGLIDLIAKIQAAIPILGRLLAMLRLVPGANIDGAVLSVSDRVRAFGAAQGANARDIDTRLREAGMTADQSYRHSLVEDLMRGADGGLPRARAEAESLADEIIRLEKTTEDAADASSGAADAAEQFAEGMADLQRQVALAGMDDFFSEVVSSAEGLGIASAELDAFVAAVQSGGLDAAPAKFRAIADAMAEINAKNLLNDLAFDQQTMFMSDIDKEIAETLRGTGIEIDSTYGRMISGQMKFNDQLEIAKGLASDFFKSFLNDLKNGVSLTDALWNALGRVGEQMFDKAIDDLLSGAFQGMTQPGGFMGVAANDNAAAGGFQTMFDAVFQGSKEGTTEGWGGLAGFMKQNGGNIMAGLAGLGVGYQTQDPLMGALMGGLGGIAGGPVGMAIGAIGGLIGGIFGMNKALEEARQKVEENREAIETFIAAANGEKVSAYAKTLADFNKQAEELISLAEKARDQALVDDLKEAQGNIIPTLGKEFVDELQRSLNSLRGDEWLNEVADAQEQYNMRLKDAELLGVSADGALEELVLTIKEIAKESGLTEAQIALLTEKFPDIADALGDVVDTLASGVLDRLTDLVDQRRAELREAYEREASDLDALIERHKSIAEQLKETIRSLKLDGSLSPLSPENRMEEARARFEEVRTRALAGDPAAMEELNEVSRTYLEEARNYYASSETYFQIFELVQATLTDALVASEGQLTEAQQQRALLDQQVAGLIDINNSVRSVVDAIRALQAAMAAQKAAGAFDPQSYWSSTLKGFYQELQAYKSATGSSTMPSELVGVWNALFGAKSGTEMDQIAETYKAILEQINSGLTGMADGGLVAGGTPGMDSVVRRLMPGEFVMPVAPTRANRGMLEAMRAGVDIANDNDAQQILRAVNDKLGRILAVEGIGFERVAAAVDSVSSRIVQSAAEKRLEEQRR